MHREHEEMMRADYATYARTFRDLDCAQTDQEYTEMWEEIDRIEDRWGGGPHAEQWDYLREVDVAFQNRPEEMLQRVRDLAHTSADGPETVQDRSVLQVAHTYTDRTLNHFPVGYEQELTAALESRPEQRGRGIERSR
ncbi:hypothetical protein [Nocardia fusca]|uniref:Uncharacterized protein n=1 Tax=Nocardia fusca TaxID=941183 RepID=A0ABV3F8C5_9NOCA